MQPTASDWQYNSRSITLKITVDTVGIQAIHSVGAHVVRYPITVERRFEPEEIVYDASGLIRAFTYLTNQGDRLEYIAQETNIDSPAKVWGDIAVKIVDLAILGYQIHTHYKQFHDTYHKISKKQVTAQQALWDLGFWEMKVLYNRHVMRNFWSSSPVQKTTNMLHEKLEKIFPKIRPNSRVTYYEKGQKFKVEGALYV